MQSRVEFINVGNDTIGKPQFRTVEWIKDSYRRKLKRADKKVSKMKPGILSMMKSGNIHWEKAVKKASEYREMTADTLRKIEKAATRMAIREQ